MRTDTAPTISRHDYQPYPYRLAQVELAFELDAAQTEVHARLRFEAAGTDLPPLALNGEDLVLQSVALDGRALAADEYRLEDDALTLNPPSASFTVEITSVCRPAENSTLMGLYVSGRNLFTQCEAQGFRRISWFPDRPDVMSRYRVTLRGDKARYPLLLSNGNLVSTRELPNGRHEAVWEDPHPKPSYLFAVVAGDFRCREQTVSAADGRQSLLQVYCDPGAEGQTAWALDCLVRAVEWDETRFGLRLDLDRFMVVAARDFNMGAMENKGLNVFNSSYVLADPDTATDASYHAIESVIGHEYFHNWTGNRVTCRDWFQLSLKEGLTVFRDQEFSADMMTRGLPPAEAASARVVKRIDDVCALRTAQFPEDAGPMAHPIRPESYQEISNFYTATVYEKGAEVIRMQHTLLGEEGFRAGMDEYFRRHDGQAVTCDDFVDAMESVYTRRNPGKDLSVFRRWYSQAGTPRVRAELDYDPAGGTCRLTLAQRCPPAGIEKLRQPPTEKPPLLIPFAVGLLDGQGRPMPFEHQGSRHETLVLEFGQARQTWEFSGLAGRPIPSLLRNFSAPVIVEYDYADEQLALLARHDPDLFARWEAGQELANRQLLALAGAAQAGRPLVVDDGFLAVWQSLLDDQELTPAYRCRALTLPSEKILLEKTSPMDPAAVTTARRHLRAALGRELASSWLHAYHANDDSGKTEPFSPDARSAGRRALKNLALACLAAGEHPQAEALALAQYEAARTMTDRTGGLLALLVQGDTLAGRRALEDFYEQWQDNPLVVDRWFTMQATAPATRVADVRALMEHPAFTLRNPNRARALVFQFCLNNMRGVHCPEGYAFWTEQVLALDALNPEVAARLARAFDNWSRYIPDSRDALRACYERMRQHPALSRNVAEIVAKALNI